MTSSSSSSDLFHFGDETLVARQSPAGKFVFLKEITGNLEI